MTRDPHDDGTPTDRAFGTGPRAGGPTPTRPAAGRPGPSGPAPHPVVDEDGEVLDEALPSAREADDEADDEADEPDDDGIVRAKWLIDGATTLAEAADQLQAEADRLRAMHEQGWTFTQPVVDDYGFLRKPAGSDAPAV